MGKKPHLLQIGSVTPRMLDRLNAEFVVHSLFDQKDRAGFLAAHGAGVHAIATDGHWGVPADAMAATPNLRVVSSYGVGYDGIDVDALVARGVIVAHTPDVLNDEVADTAVMLWMAVSRQMIVAHDWVVSGKWERDGAMPLTRSVRGRTVGIVGFGRIGQTIAKLVGAFDAKVLYHARSARDVAYEYCPDLVDMASRADVLVVITPGGPATRHLVSAAVIDALGPEGILINVARGSVVDEAAMVAALAEGRLGGAGLDVFDQEPIVPDALKSMPNVVLAPHIGSATVETRQAMGDLTCDNLSRFLADGSVLTPVPECRHLLD